jgi:hypothetical protein
MSCRQKKIVCNQKVKTKKITFGQDRKVSTVVKQKSGPKTIFYSGEKEVVCGLVGGVPCTPCFRCRTDAGSCASKCANAKAGDK